MTLVVDASAVAEILLHTPRGCAAAGILADHQLIAPQHLSVEVMSVLRGWSLAGRLSQERGLEALADFEALGVEQLPMAGLLPAVWALRHNISAYDAMYVVLARAQACALLTLDARLAASAPDCCLVPRA